MRSFSSLKWLESAYSMLRSCNIMVAIILCKIYPGEVTCLCTGPKFMPNVVTISPVINPTINLLPSWDTVDVGKKKIDE